MGDPIVNRQARELVQKVRAIGWELAPGLSGGGHMTLVHANGERYTTGSTPSDHRGMQNCIADLERIAGRKLPRANHRKSRKSFGGSGFSIEGTHNDLELRARIEDLNGVHSRQREEWESLVANPTREAAQRARDLMAEIATTEAALTQLHQPVDRIYA